MNDKLEQFTSKLLVELEQGWEFFKEQLPPLAEEVLAWELWSSIIYGLVGVFLVVFSLITWKRSWKVSVEEDAPVILLNAVGVGAGALFVLFNLSSVIKVLVAPRLVLIEVVRDLF